MGNFSPDFKPNQERPKKPYEVLAQMVENVAIHINQDAKSRYGIENLLSPEGSVQPDDFDQSRGGIYERSSIVNDNNKVFELDYKFSKAIDRRTGKEVPSVIEYYKDRNCHTREEIVAYSKKEKEKEKNKMFEKAVFILLHKFLKEEFLVVRTAAYDDYTAGVDNLFIDLETGFPICAFDEVHDSKGGEYTSKKLDKVKEIVEKGGASIRYGLTVENGQIKQTRIENVPVFAISLLQEDFEKKLLPAMQDTGIERKSDFEREIMVMIIKSLGEQAKMIESVKINDAVRENLVRFNASLDKIKIMMKITDKVEEK
jgi:hypothetical protein